MDNHVYLYVNTLDDKKTACWSVNSWVINKPAVHHRNRKKLEEEKKEGHQ